MNLNNVNFWESKYQSNNSSWDLGEVSPPLKTYFDSLENKEIKILIPGAGNAYEAEYLFNNGFKNVYIVEWAPFAINSFKTRVPNFPLENIMELDFFKLEEQFDLIIEQTFFCALPVNLREDYVIKMHELLKTNGLLVGLMFQKEFEKGPPFGGNEKLYRALFKSHFEILEMQTAHNSIKPRLGSELFVRMKAI